MSDLLTDRRELRFCAESGVNRRGGSLFERGAWAGLQNEIPRKVP